MFSLNTGQLEKINVRLYLLKQRKSIRGASVEKHNFSWVALKGVWFMDSSSTYATKTGFII